jgi:signal transduction histidine kinase
MRGFTELMADVCSGCPKPEPEVFRKRIVTSADRMDQLITDALSYTKAVREELPLAPVDAGALLRSMLDSYPEFQPSKADIKIEGELPVLMANKAGLTQCFSNLLGNAVKFVKPGQTPKVRIWADPTKRADGLSDDWINETGTSAPGGSRFTHHASAPPMSGEFVRIWVEDNGIGIPETMLPHVFEMFSRGQSTHEGTGIGLALVRKVMRRMGGRVGVKSREGEGSRFWLDLQPAFKPASYS